MFEWKTQVPFPPIKPAWPEPVTALAQAHVLSENFGSSPKRLGGASSVTGPHRETGMRQMSHYVYHDRDTANCLKVIRFWWICFKNQQPGRKSPVQCKRDTYGSSCVSARGSASNLLVTIPLQSNGLITLRLQEVESKHAQICIYR